MLKKLLILLLTIPLLFVVSCGGNDENQNGGTNNEPPITQPDTEQKPPIEIPTIKEFKNVKINDKSVTYDGNKHSLEVTGDIPVNTKITYINNDQVNVGIYKVTAILECEGYNTKTVDGTLTITKADYEVQFINKTVVYDGTEHELTIVGELPKGISVVYENNKLTNAGTITATAKFISNNPNYNDLPDLTAELTVLKAKPTITSANFKDTEFVYDGKEKELLLDCEVPSYIEVKYFNNKLTEISNITARAELTLLDTNNYEPLEKTVLEAKLSIVLDKNITYITDNYGNISITGYTGSADSIMIPEYVDGKKVTTIATQAFMNCNLKDIKLPNSITSIGDEAFSGSNLETIVLPNNLTTLGTYVFAGSRLTSITLPRSLTTIPMGTFMSTSLSTINMGDNITSVGESSFMNCSGLYSIKFSNKLKTIGKSAFSKCTNLEYINIPNSCITIEDNAFEGIAYAKVNIPKSVINMGTNVFNSLQYALVEHTENDIYNLNWSSSWCDYDLKRSYVYYDSKNTIKEFNSSLLYYYDSYKKTCKIIDYLSNDPSVIIPSTINGSSVLIARYAFAKKNIKSIVIENGVTEIGSYAFIDCEELTTVKLPNDITYVSEGLFKNCVKLVTIEIPNSVTSIKGKAFSGCLSLNNITLSTGLLGIGYDVFENCTSLTSLTFPGSMKTINDGYGLGTCTNLKEVFLERGITEICGFGSYGAFFDCKSITSVKLPNTLTTIGIGAFRDCESLTNINIPYSVSIISKYAFWNCISLKNITLPNGLISIGEHAFSDCDSLTSLIIPRSVTTIGIGAFWFCTNLKNVYCEANSKPAGWHDNWNGSSTEVIWGYKKNVL